MKKEEITLLAQILSSMREGADKLEHAQKSKDLERIRNLKNEILGLHKKMSEILKNDR